MTDLLSANFTYLNQRLAEHYGIPGVYGSQFRRVVLTDPSRGGLLGQGSILTVTSYPDRTSVVQRGKWVLENLLGNPPPPPPPDIPALEAQAKDGKQLTMRAANGAAPGESYLRFVSFPNGPDWILARELRWYRGVESKGCRQRD